MVAVVLTGCYSAGGVSCEARLRRPQVGLLREPGLTAYCGQQTTTRKVVFANWRTKLKNVSASWRPGGGSGHRHCRLQAEEETIWQRLPRKEDFFLVERTQYSVKKSSRWHRKRINSEAVLWSRSHEKRGGSGSSSSSSSD